MSKIEGADVRKIRNMLLDTFEKGASEDMGCIIYIFVRGEDGRGTGFSKRCDLDDALVAIKRIAETCELSSEAIMETLKGDYDRSFKEVKE